MHLEICPEFEASRMPSKFWSIWKVQNSRHPEGQPKLHASKILSRIWGIQNAIKFSGIQKVQISRHTYCHPEFRASGRPTIWNLRHLECHPEFQAYGRPTKITCIQNSIWNLRHPECYLEFEASGIWGIWICLAKYRFIHGFAGPHKLRSSNTLYPFLK